MIGTTNARTWLIGFVVAGAACSTDVPRVDLDTEAQAIRTLHNEWFEAENRRDLEASMSVLASGAVIQPPGAPTVSSVEDTRALYEDFFAQPYTSLTGTVTHVEVAAAGDLGYDVGTWIAVFEGPDGQTEVRGKFMAIFRKVDGKWKVAANSFSTDSPP